MLLGNRSSGVQQDCQDEDAQRHDLLRLPDWPSRRTDMTASHVWLANVGTLSRGGPACTTPGVSRSVRFPGVSTLFIQRRCWQEQEHERQHVQTNHEKVQFVHAHRLSISKAAMFCHVHGTGLNDPKGPPHHTKAGIDFSRKERTLHTTPQG